MARPDFALPPAAGGNVTVTFDLTPGQRAYVERWFAGLALGETWGELKQEDDTLDLFLHRLVVTEAMDSYGRALDKTDNADLATEKQTEKDTVIP